MDRREKSFHVVRRGDNLTGIARRYNLSMEELLKLNNLTNRSVIRKGQKLRVRAEAPTPTSASYKQRQALALASFKSGSIKGKASTVSRELPRNARVAAAQPKPQARRHTVKRGETLYDVSKKYGLSLNDLARANKVRINYRVMAGEELNIPN